MFGIGSSAGVIHLFSAIPQTVAGRNRRGIDEARNRRVSNDRIAFWRFGSGRIGAVRRHRPCPPFMVTRLSPAEFQCQLGHGTLPLLPWGPEWWRGRDWRFSSAWGSTTSRRSALVRKPLGSMPHFVTALTAGAAAEMGIAAAHALA